MQENSGFTLANISPRMNPDIRNVILRAFLIFQMAGRARRGQNERIPLPPPPALQELMAQQNEILRQLAQRQPPPQHYCDGTSQVIRPTYSCPCPTDIRHPVDVPKSLDKFGIFPYLTRNVSPVLQTLQNIGDIEVRKQLHKLTFI
jgi:hypothetical protein